MRLLLALLLPGCTEYNVNKTPTEPTVDTGTPDTSPPEDTSPPPDTDTGPPPDTGSCVDFTPPNDYTVTTQDDCLRTPTIGSFTPVVEWQWTTNPILPGYDDIMSTPAIGQLTDDDGDGDVDEDDTPDVVFTAFSGGAYTSAGALTAISGADGTTLWSTMGPGIYSSGGVAIGDLDADGWPEVCTAGTNSAVVCLNGADGTELWSNGMERSYVGAPAIADMDRDGQAEVVMGRQIFLASGLLIMQGTGGQGSSYQFSFPVDMDGDGEMEVVAGNTVYHMDNTVMWTSPYADGIPAVGDFDLDGTPDVVTVSGGTVKLTWNDGTAGWEVPVNGGGSGGAPTVADFDADGWPEVGVAGASYYTVYETDGSVKWAQPVSDFSSNVTGSSVFDFEGDGAAEVVYADEHTLWVYDGATGAVEMAETGHSSGTLFEYPLIADVDGDGSTEIVVASNNYAYAGWNGITVIGDASSSWAPAREVWNEFAYHITNVDNDAGIPRRETPNWLTWNNFRTGGTELGPSNWLSDFGPGEPAYCELDCDDGSADLYIPVENTGLLDGVDVPVRLVHADGTTALDTTAPSVPSGDGVILGPIPLTEADWGAGMLTAVVNPDHTLEECDETDNVVDVGRWPCHE